MWFPIHPLGYVLAATCFGHTMWFTALLAWLIRVIVLRIGGAHSIRRGLIPFCVGMFIACMVSIMFFDIIAIYRYSHGIASAYTKVAMMKDKYTNPISQAAVAALFLILTVVVLYIYVTIAEPPERKPGNPFTTGYSEKPLLDALTEARLQATIAQIKTASTDPNTGTLCRMTGTPGCQRTEGLISNSFAQAGLRTATQHFSAVVPVTEYCEVLDESGKALPGIKLYPFAPTGLLPTVLPPEGVAGQLVSIASTQPLDLVKKPIEGNITLVNGFPAKDDSNWWQTLAAMGTRALMVKEDPSASNAVDQPDTRWPSMSSPYDIKFPRFLVQGPIEQFAGKQLRIRCKVTWQTKQSRNLIAILPGKAPQPGTSHDALIITCYYDSNSVVPELAPGAEQAMSLVPCSIWSKRWRRIKAN